MYDDVATPKDEVVSYRVFIVFVGMVISLKRINVQGCKHHISVSKSVLVSDKAIIRKIGSNF